MFMCLLFLQVCVSHVSVRSVCVQWRQLRVPVTTLGNGNVFNKSLIKSDRTHFWWSWLVPRRNSWTLNKTNKKTWLKMWVQQKCFSPQRHDELLFDMSEITPTCSLCLNCSLFSVCVELKLKLAADWTFTLPTDHWADCTSINTADSV